MYSCVYLKADVRHAKEMRKSGAEWMAGVRGSGSGSRNNKHNLGLNSLQLLLDMESVGLAKHTAWTCERWCPGVSRLWMERREINARLCDVSSRGNIIIWPGGSD